MRILLHRPLAYGIAACLGACAWARAQERAATEVVLRNELPVSGPAVTLRPPHGAACHPGAALLLEGAVRMGGAAFDGGVSISEGESDWGARSEWAGQTPAGTPAQFRLALRVPSDKALSLSVWTAVPGGGRRDLFRARLRDGLRVLPASGRKVLQCGTLQHGGAVLPAGADWSVTPVEPARMPALDWACEDVDLLVLGRGAFEGMPEDARGALRRYVLGGGRVLIVTLDALRGAIAAGLLPLPARFGAEMSAWPLIRAAGLSDADVQVDRGGVPVFARFRLGWGGGIFFLPGAAPASIAKEGERVLTDPVLIRERAERPDARIWIQPYEFFAAGAVAPDRRRNTALWAAVGAGCLIALLAWAAGLSGRLQAAGWALGGAAFLGALLLRVFPAPELTASRVTLAESAADGRAIRWTEWAYLEGYRDLAGVQASSAAGGALQSIHYRREELEQAGTDTKLDEAGAVRITCRALPVLPLPPIFQAQDTEAPSGADAGQGATLREGAAGFEAGEVLTERLRAVWGGGRIPRGRALLNAGQAVDRLSGPDLRAMPGQPFGSPLSAVKAALPELSEPEAAARAKALAFVLDAAQRRAVNALVLFDEAPAGGGDWRDGRVRLAGPRGESGPRFQIQLIALTNAKQ